MIGGLAVVHRVLPERHGVLVKFAGGGGSYDTGDDSAPFVRVLCRRAHSVGGAEVDLPQVGELGLVVELEDGHQVWLGSIHWQDLNQIDPTPNLAMHRHTSGVFSQIRDDADMELQWPSGMRITIAKAQGALPALQRTGEAYQPPKGPCDIELEHPSGLKIHVDNDGAMGLTFPTGGTVTVDKDGKFEAKGFSEVKLQDANARFCMESLYDWVKTHVHTSAAAGSPTTAPTTQPPGSSLSPDTFKGPHA